MWIHPELIKTTYTYLPLSPQGSARLLRRGAPCQFPEEEKNASLAILLLHFTIALDTPSLQPRILEIKVPISSFSIIASCWPVGPHCIGGDSELPQLQRPQNRYSLAKYEIIILRRNFLQLSAEISAASQSPFSYSWLAVICALQKSSNTLGKIIDPDVIQMEVNYQPINNLSDAMISNTAYQQRETPRASL